MQSTIHLYNRALAELGGEQIPLDISPIEDDAVGAICQSVFPHVLDTALEAYEWSFAKKRVSLALLHDVVEESRGYAFRYRIPSDCMMPVRVLSYCCFRKDHKYEIEGKALLCDVEDAELLYIERVTDPRRWPGYFSEVLVWKLASILSTSRNNDMGQKQRCEQMHALLLAKACAKDRAIQNARQSASAWEEARGNGHGRRFR